MLEGDLGRPTHDIDRARFVVDHGRQVEDLEDAVERDKRGHDVHLHVGKRRERAVQPCEVEGKCDKGPERQVAVRCVVPTDAVDHRRRQRGGEHEAGEKDPAVHGRCYPDVPHTPCPGLEHVGFVLWLADQADEAEELEAIEELSAVEDLS